MSRGHRAVTGRWLIRSGDPRAAADRERAHRLGIACVTRMPTSGFVIVRDTRGLTLQRAGAPGVVRCAFADATEARRLSGARQSTLARAFGLHRHAPGRVLDATAGLGRDARALASLGCTLTLIEREPLPYALLADAHEAQAANRPGAAVGWAPIHADATRWLAGSGADTGFDAILLDPMFDTARRKAQPQKALAWLAELAGRDVDAAALFNAARAHGAGRVVVKRHARAAPLADDPDLQFRGRSIRFDVYFARP